MTVKSSTHSSPITLDSSPNTMQVYNCEYASEVETTHLMLLSSDLYVEDEDDSYNNSLSDDSSAVLDYWLDLEEEEFEVPLGAPLPREEPTFTATKAAVSVSRRCVEEGDASNHHPRRHFLVGRDVLLDTCRSVQLQEPLEAKDSEQDLEQQEVELPTAATSKWRSHQLSLELKDEEDNLEDSLHLSRTRLPNILHRRQRGSKKKQEEEEAFSDMEDDYEDCAEFAE